MSSNVHFNVQQDTERTPLSPTHLMLDLYHNYLAHRHTQLMKDLFIVPQEFVVGYSKAPKQPQSSARPICHSHTMSSSGREPATVRIAAYRSSPRYALYHGRQIYRKMDRCRTKTERWRGLIIAFRSARSFIMPCDE